MNRSVKPVVQPGFAGISRPKPVIQRLRPFLFFAGILATALPCFAIAVKPTYQVFAGKPGETIDAQMMVTNDTNETMTYEPSVKDWAIRPDSIKNVKAEEWLKINTQPFTLKPGESHLFKYKLETPKKIRGEVNGAVTFSSRKKGSTVTLQMSLVQYLAVAGTEHVDSKITNIAVNRSSDTTVGVIVQNLGNVHLRPKGWVYVDNVAGQRVLNVELKSGQPVFVGGDHVYSGTVPGFVLSDGNYTARIELEDMDRPYVIPPVTKKFKLLPNGKVEVR